MKKVTKAQNAKLEKLKDELQECIDNVYGGDAVPFKQCLEMCSEKVRKSYFKKRQEVVDFECELLFDGRGYRDSYGHFRSY